MTTPVTWEEFLKPMDLTQTVPVELLDIEEHYLITQYERTCEYIRFQLDFSLVIDLPQTMFEWFEKNEEEWLMFESAISNYRACFIIDENLEPNIIPFP